jgi:hypothetical protein
MAKKIFQDSTWTEEQWLEILQKLVTSKMVTWREISALTLGHLNPSQVGTSLASSEGFKLRYGKGNTMQVVLKWFYEQEGICVDCKTRLELQADHVKPREKFKNPLEADYIENMILRCRRCNVVKRESHALGGLTFLTTEAALMWLLLNFKPRTLNDFILMGRLYGLTMADVRLQEGWAMANWLGKDADLKYELDTPAQRNNVYHWGDGSITRTWTTDRKGQSPKVLLSDVASSSHVAFIGSITTEKQELIYFICMPLYDIPFSHYEIDPAVPQTLSFSYSTTTKQLTSFLPENFSILHVTSLEADQPSSLTLEVNGKSLVLDHDGGRTKRKILSLPLGAPLKNSRLTVQTQKK